MSNEVFDFDIRPLQFPTGLSWLRVSSLLGVVLAALTPATPRAVHAALCAADVTPTFSWHDFSARLRALAGLLHQRHDGGLVCFHAAFRDWLVRRPETEPTKFMVDLRSVDGNI